MSNNYAGNETTSKDITDLMCRVNALEVSIPYNRILWSYNPPAGWRIQDVQSSGGYYYFTIDYYTISFSPEFRILKYDMDGELLETYSFTKSELTDIPSSHDVISCIAFSFDKNDSDLIWLYIASTKMSFPIEAIHQFVYTFRISTLAISKKIEITMSGGGALWYNVSNIQGGILGEESEDYFIFSRWSNNTKMILSRYDYSGSWSETVLMEFAGFLVLSGWHGNNFIINRTFGMAGNPEEVDINGNVIAEIAHPGYVTYSNGILCPLISYIGVSYDFVDLSSTIIFDFIQSNFNSMWIEHYNEDSVAALYSEFTNPQVLYIFSSDSQTEWFLYNADPALKRSIGYTPGDNDLAENVNDGVYTLPEAGYCTNLIEDLRDAIEQLVSWGYWKNPSTGNAYNWTDSDPDNAYHCAMASCYADYGLSSAGYDWTRSIEDLLNQPIVDLEPGEIDAILTLLENADV